MTDAENFDFDAGELSLDFANTAEMHASDKPDELLNEFGDLDLIIAGLYHCLFVAQCRLGNL